MTAQEKEIMIDRVDRGEKLSEQDEFLYLTEIMGVTENDARFIIDREKIIQEHQKKGVKVIL